jgi:hypothetical protein
LIVTRHGLFLSAFVKVALESSFLHGYRAERQWKDTGAGVCKGMSLPVDGIKPQHVFPVAKFRNVPFGEETKPHVTPNRRYFPPHFFA